MRIEIFPLGPIDTNAYLVSNPETRAAVLIDAPFGAAQTIGAQLEKEGLKLEAVLLTHGHWDHIGDAAKIAELCKVPIVAGEGSRGIIEDPQLQQRYLFAGDELEPAKVDVCPEDGRILEYAGLKIKCIAVDGHCPGSIAYVIEDGGKTYAFVGDLIFQNSVGRTDLWGGDFQTLAQSVKKIYSLPDETEILCGHGEPTTVGIEKQTNPFVRA